MKTLELKGREQTGQNRELRIRSGIGVDFAVGMAIFLVWFIATHLTRYSS
jgi:hypothetical protein